MTGAPALSPAVKIAQVLPVFAGLDAVTVRAHLWGSPIIPQSTGEKVAADWAVATERLLEWCDRETVDALLEAVATIRARMVAR